jgi:Cu2+-exporting ATPase
LRELLREPERAGSDAARSSSWWQRLSKIYVLAVLVVAAAALVGWWAATGDLSRALSVATAVLIVTCPCAFGIAAPLAYEMAQAGLRRRGLFVRRGSFLERARSVRRVVFDKTGTLTTGALALANPEALAGLSVDARQVLYDLVARSGHPKSTAIREALDARAPLALRPEVTALESPGLGVEARVGGRLWRLGAAAWVVPGQHVDPACDVIFGCDGRLVAALRTSERLRPDAASEIRRLEADGCEVWLLSGDASSRVEAAGATGGVPSGRCVGDQMPRDKADFLRAHDRRDTLFVGDGVNDAVALDVAHTSGTPAVDRPYVPARADFFFVTAGLGPIRLALRTSRVLAQVVRADLAIALAYNTLTVGLAVCGRMSPLACAVLMPVSSLTTIFATVVCLSPRSRLWTS